MTGRLPTGAAARAARRAARGVVLGLIVAAPLAIGSVHLPVQLAVYLAAAVALVAALVERRATSKPFPVPLPAWALGLAVLATALQLLPMPVGVLRAVSPYAAETLAMTRPDAALHPLTLDPAGTWHQLAKSAAYLAFFLAAAAVAADRRVRHCVVGSVIVAAFAASLLGLVQAIVGTDRIVFLYSPRESWAVTVRGTFVNPNHFGALATLGAACSLGVALRHRRWRGPALAALAVVDLAGILTFARATVASLLAAHAIVLLFAWYGRRTSRLAETRRLFHTLLALGIAFAVATVVLLGLSRTSARLHLPLGEDELQREAKVDLWSQATELVWAAPWTGTGRGAFETAFTRVARQGGAHRYPFVENGYLQAVVDWGIPVALALAVLAVASAAVAWRRARTDLLYAGALAALLGLAVHEAADFAVELPGVALPALGLAAVLFGRSTAKPQPGRVAVRASPALFAIPAAGAIAACVAAVQPTLDDDVAAITSAANDAALDPDALISRANGALRRHPASYLVAAATAERLVRERHPAAAAWLNRALFLNPTYAPAHVIVADWLAAVGRKRQALLEYRAAFAHALDWRSVIERVARRFPALEDLMEAVPQTPRGLLGLAKWLTANGRGEDAAAVYARALDIDPTSRRALRVLADRALAHRDLDAATRYVRRLREVDASPATAVLAVRERLLAGDVDGAVTIADRELEGSVDFGVEIDIVRALAARGDFDRARLRLDRLARRVEADPHKLARVHDARSEVEDRAGNPHQARWERERAAQLRAR